MSVDNTYDLNNVISSADEARAAFDLAVRALIHSAPDNKRANFALGKKIGKLFAEYCGNPDVINAARETAFAAVIAAEKDQDRTRTYGQIFDSKFTEVLGAPLKQVNELLESNT